MGDEDKIKHSAGVWILNVPKGPSVKGVVPREAPLGSGGA